MLLIHHADPRACVNLGVHECETGNVGARASRGPPSLRPSHPVGATLRLTPIPKRRPTLALHPFQ